MTTNYPKIPAFPIVPATAYVFVKFTATRERRRAGGGDNSTEFIKGSQVGHQTVRQVRVSVLPASNSSLKYV
jgi:hypothetical protein